MSQEFSSQKSFQIEFTTTKNFLIEHTYSLLCNLPSHPQPKIVFKMDNLRPHATTTYKAWRKLQKLINGQEIKANGHELEIAIVVAVSKSASLP
jgi:hypothetical protein